MKQRVTFIMALAYPYSHDDVHGYKHAPLVSVVGSRSQQGYDALRLAHVTGSMVSIHILNSCRTGSERALGTQCACEPFRALDC